ncbi:hypothetical protein FJZ31_07590 [Candidatus Poribacteria bacterium]|nr:hypothetical protein [Candidatus Poribacteria bacterium]
MELVVEEIDGGILGGEAWHAELLRQVHLDLPDIRPPVLSQETCEQLDEYRKFRHRVRNIYAMNLLPDRMEDLVTNLPTIWHRVRTELQAVINFLKQLSEAE